MGLSDPFGSLGGPDTAPPQSDIEIVVDYLVGDMQFIYSVVSQVVNFFGYVFWQIIRFAKRVGRFLRHLQIVALWHALEKWYHRFKGWIDWYRRYISAPLRLLHNAQRLLYDTFFRPIIEVVDTVRQITSLIRVFNPKLAARIDRAIFGLEQKILAPFLFMTRRLNLMLSSVQAIVTATGLIDADIFIGSIQRDITSIRRLMTFNFGHQPAGAPVDPLQVLRQDQADFDQFVSSGTGPLAQQVDAMTRTFDEAFLALGG